MGVQVALPNRIELPAEVKSLKETPRFVPVMVMVVPPSGGPDFGVKSVIVGLGHCEPEVKSCDGQSPVKVQVSVIPLGLSHQPHSNPVTMLTPRQGEQPSVKAAQL